MSELSRLEQRIKELENEVVRKKQIIQDMSSVLQESEDQYEEIKKENAKLKADLANVNKQPNKDSSSSNSKPTGEEDDESIEDKVKSFLSSLLSPHTSTSTGTAPIPRALLHSLIINMLAAVHHLDRNEEVRPTALSLDPSISSWREGIQGESDVTQEDPEIGERLKIHASYIAFQSALAFFTQLSDLRREKGAQYPEQSYPFQWLLGMFPFNSFSVRDMKDTLWLPLHLHLSVDTIGKDLDSYCEELKILLKVFGAVSFTEEVNPLSLYVAQRFPQIEVVEVVLSLFPSALSRRDEDGTTPLMHACAANERYDLVSYILEREPQSVYVKDTFGANAFHYACFFGSFSVAELLLKRYPDLVSFTEGNGALPLHDAVQNRRGEDTQYLLVRMLLQADVISSVSQDTFGALPLHYAARYGSEKIFQALLSIFPEGIQFPDNEGLLPMHY
ncbi:hypothetical protein EON64_18405, partial [archaeon]